MKTRHSLRLFLAGSALAVALTTMSSHATTVTWDANGTTTGQTDGAGDWWTANLWWNGSSNIGWTSGWDVIFGNGGTGGAVTLSTATTVNSLTFNSFSGTYSLGTAAKTITLNGNLTMNSGAGAVTFLSPITLSAPSTMLNNSASTLTLSSVDNGGNLLTIDGSGTTQFGSTSTLSGAGGLTKNGTGYLNLYANTPTLSMTGSLVVNGGEVLLPNNSFTTPTGNFTLNGGVIMSYWGDTLSRSLGTGVGQIQILGGVSGFSGQGTTGMTVKINNNASYEVVWGAANEAGNVNATGYFNPSTLVLQSPHANPGGNINFQNPIDLNGTTRTIAENRDPAADPTHGMATISGVIRTSSGTAGLTKTGVGPLILTGANTFNGPVTVSQGILSVNSINTVANANPLGKSSAAASNLLLANGTTLQYTGGAASCDRSFTINGTNAGDSASLDASGSGALNLTSTATPAYGTADQTRTLVLTGSYAGGNNILAANIANNGAGAVSVTKTGAGTWQLSGASSYTGATTLSAGTLSIGASNNLGGSSANLVFDGGTLQITGTGLTSMSGLGHPIVFNSGKTVGLDINSSSNTFTADQILNQGTGGLTKLGTGTLVINQANTYTGQTTISAGTLRLDAGGTLSAVPLYDNGTFAVNRSGTVTLGADIPAIIGGTGGVTNIGSGTLVLNAPTFYTGTTAVIAGTIKLSSNLAIQNSALDTTGAGFVTLDTGITTPTIGGLAASGTARDLATVISSGYGNMTNLTLNPAGSVTYGGVIANGASGMTLTMIGAGTQTLQGVDSYSGATYLNAGTLNLSGSGSILNSAITLNGGGIMLTNTAAETGSGRINNSTGITSNGGTITYANTSTNNIAYAETVGSVALTSGQLNLVESANQTGTGTSSQTLTLSGLTHSGITNSSAVTFSAATTGPNTTTNKFVVTGASATTTGQIIGPWATTGTAAATQTDYAIYNGSAQVVPAAIAASTESSWTTAANAYTSNAVKGGITLTGTRNITALRSISAANSVTFTANNPTITLTSHTLNNGDVVVFGGTTVPTGLTAGTPYFVVNAAANTFQVSATSGGGAITPTTAGSAVNATGAILVSSGNNLGTTGILNGVSNTLTIAATGTGAVTLPTTTSDYLHVNPGSGPITINAPITNNGVGVLTLVKDGGGTLTLNGTNTYTGGTVINGGSVSITTAANLGGTGSNVTFNGTGTLADAYNSVVSFGALAINGAGTMATLAGGSGSSQSITFTGSVTGNGSLVVTSPGGGYATPVYLTSTANTFTGPITLAGASGYTDSITVNSLGDAAGAGAIQLGYGTYSTPFNYGSAAVAPLTLNYRQIVLGGTTGGTIQNNSTTQAITINTNLGIAATGNKTLTLGAVAGPANVWGGTIGDGVGASISLSKTGAGTWNLSGTNSYTGGTALSGGMLQFSKTAAMPAVGVVAAATGTTLAVNVGGAGEWTTGTSGNGTIGGLLGGLGGQSGGTVTYSGTATLGLDTTNATSTQTYAGNIANVGTTLGIRKLGPNTLQLTGTNTYTGTTTISDGTLEIKSGASSLTQTLGALTLAGPDVTLSSNKSGAGSLSTTFGSLTARVAGDTANIVSTGGTIGTDNSIKLTQAAGFIDKGVYFNGADFAAMNVANTYVRALAYGSDTNASAVGVIASGKYTKLTSTPASQAAISLLSLNLSGSGVSWTTTSGNLTVPAIIKSGGGSQSTISGGNLTTSSNAELVIRTDTSSDSLAISANLTQGSGQLTKSGAGTLTLSGTNTYTGQTYVNGGMLSIGANVNLGDQATGAQLNLRGGTLQATGTFGLYNGSAGTNNRAVVLTGAAGFDVTGTNTLTVAGTVGGSGSLTKTNTGTLALTNTNTYTGPTAVSAGKLLVSGSIGGSAVTVSNSGTVLASGATGTIGNSVAINSGAILSPGDAGTAGTATVTTATTFNDGSLFSWDISANGTGYDKLVNASLTDGGSVGGSVLRIVAADPSFANTFWTTAHTWNDIITTNGSTPIANWASIFTTVSLVNSSLTPITPPVPGAFVVSGNTLTWTAVPEPTTALAGILLGAGLLRRRRTVAAACDRRVLNYTIFYSAGW